MIIEVYAAFFLPGRIEDMKLNRFFRLLITVACWVRASSLGFQMEHSSSLPLELRALSFEIRLSGQKRSL
jgi:hypothetical protein